MKKNYPSLYKLLIICLFVLIPYITNGQNEKKKYVQNKYSVGASTKLQIENKFGDITINSWKKNEFDIRVEIVSKGRNSDRVQKILEGIKIDISESSSKVSFESIISHNKNKYNEGFEINYIVYMPEENPLEIKNSFGDITMENRSNDLDIKLSYGAMKVGNVTGKLKIKLAFGNGNIANITNGDITIKHSNFELEKATVLMLEQGFSDVEINQVTDLKIESKYGKITIEKARNIDGDVAYSEFKIGELTQSLILNCSYIGNFQINKLAKTFTLIDINGKFGSYKIGLEDGLHANIYAEFSYASLKYDSDTNASFHYLVKESNRSYYRGKIGLGDKNKVIQIDSNYGNLYLKKNF